MTRRALAALGATVVVGTLGFAVWLARPQPPPLAWRALANASYAPSVAPRGVTLADGIFDAPAAPGSASRIVVRLADVGAFGDLDGDGAPDAAVILISSGGGTGTFVELAAVRNEQGEPHPVASVLLGDRVLVREVRVEDRTVLVRLRARGATDPLSLLTKEVTRRYALERSRLVLREETETQVRSAPADDYVYNPVRLEVAAGSSRSVDGVLTPGGIASYVVHGRLGQTLDLGVRSEFNNAVLSVSALTDGVTLLSRRDYSVQRALELTSEQDYAVKVVSLAGYRLTFALDVRLRAAAQSPASSVPPSAQPLPAATPSPAPTSPPPAAGEHPLGDASAPAVSFARSRSPVWGVAVVIPSRALSYAENGDVQVPTASVVKVLVMVVLLEQARDEHRPLTEDELALLWPMISESDNDATSQLWERIGRGQAVGAYLRRIGVAGFTPDPGTSWGVSFASARAMATVLGKLLSGEILDDPSRALALRLLESVVPEQRWGITAGADETGGARVAVKNGWYPGEEGWRVNSVGIVRPRAAAPYAMAIVTDARATWREGIETIEGISERVNADLRSTQ